MSFVAPNEIIFEENDPGNSLYLIAQGSVKISKKGRAAQQETLAYLMENDSSARWRWWTLANAQPKPWP